MKLGISLLVSGLLIAGIYGWYYYIPIPLFPHFPIPPIDHRLKRYLLLLMILGVGLAIGGIVRMVVN